MHALMADLPLVLDNVSLDVGGARLIDRVDLTISPGAPTLIVGPNGAGKTSLLRLCMGLVVPTSGRVSWGSRLAAGRSRRNRLPASGDVASQRRRQCAVCVGAGRRAAS